MGMPSYQASAIKAYLAKNPKTGTLSYAQNGRGSPDVSLLGEKFEVYTSGWNGGLEKIAVGGTSASTPTWGAIISLLNEECLSASGGSKTLGFVNPLFYQNADAFNDITKGSNAIGNNAASGWKCTSGWDAATGLGTPKFTNLQSGVSRIIIRCIDHELSFQSSVTSQACCFLFVVTSLHSNEPFGDDFHKTLEHIGNNFCFF